VPIWKERNKHIAQPYSEDLRKRAMDLIDNKGCTIQETTEALSISKATLYLWRKQRREKGTLAPEKNWRKGHSHKIKDLNAFKKFVDQHQGCTAQEMANQLGNISLKTVCKYLKRMGYTRKKNSRL